MKYPKKFMIRTEDDSACKLVIHTETKEQALAGAEAMLGIAKEELIAIESPLDDARFESLLAMNGSGE